MLRCKNAVSLSGWLLESATFAFRGSLLDVCGSNTCQRPLSSTGAASDRKADGAPGTASSGAPPELMYSHHFREKPKLDLVKKYLSPDHFNASERNKVVKHDLIREMQAFDQDTGTMPVQIALISHRIEYLTAHCRQHKKDHHTRRGLLILLSRRRKQLKYLRRQNFDRYVQVLRRFNLKDNYYLSGWGERYRVGTNLKWTPDQADQEFLGPPEEQRAALAARRRPKKPVKVPGGGVATPKVAAQLEKSAEIAANRRRRLVAAWQARLQARTEYLPVELQAEGNAKKLAAARAQRGDLSQSEWEAWQEARRAERASRQAAAAEEKRAFASRVLAEY